MRIDIEEMEAISKRLGEINGADLKDIEWYKNGEKLSIKVTDVDEWKYVGLNNYYFWKFLRDRGYK